MGLTWIIVSTPIADYEWAEKLIYRTLPSLKLLIKEFGKEGDHPHLNAIVDFGQAKEMDEKAKTSAKNWRQMVLRIANREKNHLEPDVWVRTKKVGDLVGLIGGYLQKENVWEVLQNEGKFDLDDYAKQNARRITELALTYACPYSYIFRPPPKNFVLWFLNYVECHYIPTRTKEELLEYNPFYHHQQVYDHIHSQGIQLDHLPPWKMEHLEFEIVKVYKSGGWAKIKENYLAKGIDNNAPPNPTEDGQGLEGDEGVCEESDHPLNGA